MEQFTIGISPDFDTPARGPLVPAETFDEAAGGADVRFARLAEQVAEYRPKHLSGCESFYRWGR